MNHFATGTIVDGRYRVDALLGRGSSGEVYKVYDTIMDLPVAIKFYSSVIIGADPIETKRFEREARALSQMSHPGIVKVYRYGYLENNLPFVVMEFIQGKTLGQYLTEKGVLSCSEATELALKLCAALAHAHNAQVVHRDLKPENILLIQDETGTNVKVLDFGLCKIQKTENTATATESNSGIMAGTPFYMSPEQCRVEKVDQRSDIYSFGCMFFEMLTGSPPFVGASPAETMLMQMNQPVPELQTISEKSALSKKLDRIIARCTAKDADSRYRSFHELEEDLRDETLNSQASFSRSDSAKFYAVMSPKRLLIAALVLIVFGILALALFKYFEVDTNMMGSPSRAIANLSSRFAQAVNSGDLALAEQIQDRSLNSKLMFKWTLEDKEELLFCYFNTYKNKELFDKAFDSGITVLEIDLVRIINSFRFAKKDRYQVIAEMDLHRSSQVCNYLLANENKLSSGQWLKLFKLFETKDLPRTPVSYLLLSQAHLRAITLDKISGKSFRKGGIRVSDKRLAEAFLFLEYVATHQKGDFKTASYAISKLESIKNNANDVGNRKLEAYLAFLGYGAEHGDFACASFGMKLIGDLLESGVVPSRAEASQIEYCRTLYEKAFHGQNWTIKYP